MLYRTFGRRTFLARLFILTCPLAIASGLLAGFVSATEQEPHTIPWRAQTTLVFASQATGSAIMGEADEFVQSMTPIDRQLRLGSHQPIDTAAYLEFARQQVQTWTASEEERIRSAATQLATRLEPFPASLWPAQVHLIKTTGREESQAPHCRGPRAVVLPVQIMRLDGDQLERLLAHELFHILSRQSAARQEALYAILGFERTSPIKLPPHLATRKLTNPDAPHLNCVLTIRHAEQALSLCPVLLTKESSYETLDKRSLFGELLFQLLAVQKTDLGWQVDESPPDQPHRLFSAQELPEFGQRIGRNTHYIIHPEETLADNFAHLVLQTPDLPDPWVVTKLRETLMSWREEPSTP